MTEGGSESSLGEQAIGDDAVLPPDGTTIYVDKWRRRFLWLPIAVYGFFALGGVVLVVQRGQSAFLLLPAAAWGLAGAAMVRGALAGMSLGTDGVRIRGVLRTRVWPWEEVAGFELRAHRLPRLVVGLKNGRTVGVYGFYTNSRDGLKRARAIRSALEERRKTENERRGFDAPTTAPRGG